MDDKEEQKALWQDKLLARKIATALADWFCKNGRLLPWRETTDPYKIWLSEIILQQTRIDQGTAYYFDFLKAFPTIESLAQASEEEVLRLWQGLGYYTRARNLHKAAQKIVQEWRGVFPSSYEKIRTLPGVGDYTAGAIASFAFGLSYPAVDGNLQRVLSRVYASSEPVDSTAGKKLYLRLAHQIIEEGDASVLNQALMDIGATVCTPRLPLCDSCPLESFCKVANLPQAVDFPIKKRKVPLKDLYFFFFYLMDGEGKIVLEKRKKKDIWQGLYQLPLIESETPLKQEELREKVEQMWGVEVAEHVEGKVLRAKHILSHRRLHLTFYRSSITTLFDESKTPWCEYRLISAEDLEQYPLPAAIFKYLPSFLEE